MNPELVYKLSDTTDRLVLSDWLEDENRLEEAYNARNYKELAWNPEGKLVVAEIGALLELHPPIPFRIHFCTSESIYFPERLLKPTMTMMLDVIASRHVKNHIHSKRQEYKLGGYMHRRKNQGYKWRILDLKEVKVYLETGKISCNCQPEMLEVTNGFSGRVTEIPGLIRCICGAR